MTFNAKQRVAIENWIGTAAPLKGDFFRSVERRYMDPEDVLSGKGTAKGGGRFAAMGMSAVYLSTTDAGASKEITARKSRLGGAAQISTARYPRVIFAVAVALDRSLRLDDLKSSAIGILIAERCLNRDDLTQSMEVATILEKAGIQGVVFPSVVEGGDDNLVVYVVNCAPPALQIQNEDEFVQEAKRIATKRK